ncbi:hypothetical protein [Streptomyces sp. KL116D]|uniref:hypothetical protein n=1 Tax=Streptomyces sp. KL116D TaxID=3045152 RepID=UPI0035560AAB
MGLLPGYDQIGAAALVLLILLRMIQGVAMGGEWGGAVLIATEYAPPKRKLLYGAFAQQGSPGRQPAGHDRLPRHRPTPGRRLRVVGLARPVPVLGRPGRRRPLHPPRRLAETPEMQAAPRP